MQTPIPKKLISFNLIYHKLTFYLQKALENNPEPNRPQLFRLMYSCIRSLLVLRLTKDLKLKTMYSCIRSLLVLCLTKDLKLKTISLLSSPQNLFRPIIGWWYFIWKRPLCTTDNHEKRFEMIIKRNPE